MRRMLKKNFNKELRKNRNRVRTVGTAERPRLSVFRSNKYTYAQLIDDSRGHTLVAASTKELNKKGKKTEAAKELGILIGEKAKKAGVRSAAFNRAFYQYHGRVKAVAEGAREAGLKI